MKFTRRQFAHSLASSMGSLAALSSLTTLTPGQTSASQLDARQADAPQTAAQGVGRKLRYCIVGLGRISMDHFMPACKMSRSSEVTALVSGHRDKAEKIAGEYNVPAKNIYTYANYNEIAANKDIDAVYIALPNSMHAEFTIRAANAGKHVLCEKPMATTVKDSQAMINASKAADRKLMIAYRCHYEPTNLRAMKMIRDGTLGTIQAIESANGFVEKLGEWRLNKKLAGGGPLLDVGVYSLNACRYLTGEEPQRIEAFSSVIDKDERFKDVEENVSWNMRFPSGIIASCNTTYGAPMNGYYRVHGTKGILHVEPAFSYQGLHLRADIQGQPPIDEPNPAKDPSQFAVQADYFADCVFTDKEPKTDGQEGLRDMQLMAQIYKSCGRSLG